MGDKRTVWTLRRIAGAACGVCVAASAAQADGGAFFLAAASPAVPTGDGIYPHGRRLAYMGYSGVPARDLTNGFTVAGPCYGNDAPYVRMCASNGWPVVAHIAHGHRFTEKDPAKNYVFDEPSLRTNVAAEVQALAPLKEIVWWAVQPEELRPWRKSEMQYLAVVCDEVRARDPLRRPVYLYNPNNRTCETLAPIARQVDVLAKGCYVNSVGKKRERAWLGWSVEQELAALAAAGRPGAIPLVMPVLSQDPEPGEEGEIRAWVRHDVYLGLARGAKGVLIWSLFRRREVAKTWPLWYDAYAECGRELNGARGLAQVFLFGGTPEAKLDVRLARGEEAARVTLGGQAGGEAVTTDETERRERDRELPSWVAREFVYGDAHWLFVVNSANDAAAFEVRGWPADVAARDGFTSAPVALAAALRLELPAYGVAAVRFAPAAGGGHP